MFQCDAGNSRRTLTESRRINIPGTSSNKSIMVQANDSILGPRRSKQDYVFSIRDSLILTFGFSLEES